MERPLKIAGVCGSLRQDSVNKKLLDLAKTMLPDNVEYEYVDYSDVPVFNEDIEQPVPESVQRIKNQVESADIILFATPQYNGSYPGNLKNAIDWMTRPGGDNSIFGKVAGIVGATPGQSGTMQAQLHLREVLSHLGIQVPAQPRVMVSGAYDMLDEEGNFLLPEVESNNYRKLLDELYKLAEVKSM
ncbi:chromate reductase [Alkalibacillus flavidus]|uniref:Chromate reductase n=1 Tax=Alkalibacillus flavidus TaxID=546021 RepID=A0ABV2L023_9BACI